MSRPVGRAIAHLLRGNVFMASRGMITARSEAAGTVSSRLRDDTVPAASDRAVIIPREAMKTFPRRRWAIARPTGRDMELVHATSRPIELNARRACGYSAPHAERSISGLARW